MYLKKYIYLVHNGTHPSAGIDSWIPCSVSQACHHLLNRHLMKENTLIKKYKYISISSNTVILSHQNIKKSPYLNLLRVHNINRNIKSTQHNVAVSIAVMRRPKRGPLGAIG